MSVCKDLVNNLAQNKMMDSEGINQFRVFYIMVLYGFL